MSNQNCPVCKEPLAAPPKAHPPKSESWAVDHWLIECPRCGDFKIADWARTQIERPLAELNLKDGDRENLSAWIRTEWTRTERQDDVIRGLEDILHDVRNRNYQPADKQQRLLRHLQDQTKHVGHRVRVNLDTDFPVSWSHNRDELEFHLKELLHYGSVEVNERTERHWIVSVTASGLAHWDDRPDVGFHAV